LIPHKKRQLVVLWTIWGALFSAIIIYQFALGGGIPTGENKGPGGVNFAVMLGVGQIVAASVVRWLLLPRAKHPGQVLVFMVIGLALSEGAEFYGLFLVPKNQPSTQLAMWLLSLLSALQFIPIYAKSENSAEAARML
jgi:hypothetical protein